MLALPALLLTLAQDSTLTALLSRASSTNRLPATLAAYTAQVETEISIVARREEGTEATAAIEQVASRVAWRRDGPFEQTVIGYRNQQVGANVSLLPLFETGWLNPLLYGNRLRLRASTGGSTRASRTRSTPPRNPTNAPPPDRTRGGRDDGSDTLPAIHPLAPDRDRYYRYAGGDTVVTIRTGDRIIPIVYVRVTPRPDIRDDVVLFDGELALDASRGALVRLRGTFRRATRSRTAGAFSLGDAVAFIEYENGERLGRYWLPARQRVELQASSPLLGDTRAVVRIVSRFRDMDVREQPGAETRVAATGAARDSSTLTDSTSTVLVGTRRRFTILPADSLARFGGWLRDIGGLSQGMHSDDFLSLAPDRWRPDGPPRVDVTPPRASDLIRYNRVEGLFTGVGVRWALRDLAPGVTVRATGGYAWAERTVRGRVQLERVRGATSLELRAGRTLDITNDFRAPFDSGNSSGVLLGSIDPYDYVSRSGATLALVRRVGTTDERRRAIMRAEVGIADDRWRPASVLRGPVRDTAFRPNHGVDEGTWLRSALLMEWHPDRAPEFVTPGWSGRALLENGMGGLAFTRAEARLTWRQPVGPFVWVARGDVGAVIGHGRDPRIPPQQLFELGRFQNLPAYGDKQFAGSRAAAVRSSLQYTTPWLRNPIRVRQRFWLPALSPGLSIGVQSGWADAPSRAAREAIQRLDTRPPDRLALYAPIATPTNGLRASVTAGARLFGGGLFLGGTRAVDNTAPWRALIAFGQVW